MRKKNVHMLHQLDLAQAGESDAKSQVCIWVWDHFQYRLKNLFSKDTAVDREDMRQIFWEGVLYGIEKDKFLGDRLYYLSQCGWWAVKSAVRQAERQGALSRPNITIRHFSDGGEIWTDEAVDERADTPSLVIERDYQAGVVKILAARVPAGNPRKAFCAIMEGKIGDPTAPGANKRLAAVLEVSPQRASQLMAQLKNLVIDIEEEDDAFTERALTRQRIEHIPISD